MLHLRLKNAKMMPEKDSFEVFAAFLAVNVPKTPASAHFLGVAVCPRCPYMLVLWTAAQHS